MKKQNAKTRYLVQLAVLTAVLILLELTGLGMLKFGVIEMTILQVPVIIGAIVMGPAAGGILGGVFGAISLWECISGRSAFGAVLLGINPLYTVLVCLVPRILMGLFCGWIFRLFRQETRRKSVYPFAVAGLSGAVLNTVLFMTALMLLFGGTEYLRGLQGGASTLKFVVAMVGVQGLVEAAVCCVLGSAISKALYHAMRL